MKKLMAALLLALMLPSCALAQIQTDLLLEGGNQLIVFSAQADMPEAAPGKAAAPDPALMAISMQIEARFEQEKAKIASGRAGASVMQDGGVYQDGKTASMWRIWQGEQADGTDGSSAAALTVSLETGMEIYLDELFDDPQAAFAAMEAIIEEEVLGFMSDYMEYGDLLPMPTDSYSFDETGLTIYYPEDRYRYFSGECGSVTFYWYELADYIGESSPVYALAHPDVPYGRSEIEALCFGGELGVIHALELREPLEHIAQRVLLADPDYTTDALVYPLERERGFAVEIPKYAETDEAQTPVSALRASRISFAGLLTTGKTTDVEAMKLLGNPGKTVLYDEDAAFDAMLEAGESLFYEIEGNVLQLHFDESGVLSCLILRDAMPESLF